MQIYRLISFEFGDLEEYYFTTREKALEFEERYVKMFDTSHNEFEIEKIPVDPDFQAMFGNVE